MRNLRVAVLVGFAPRKLGSLERWTLGLAEEAQRRGYDLDIFSRGPVHPTLAKQFDELGVGWSSLDELEARPIAGALRLARYDVLHVNLISVRSRIATICFAAWPARLLLVDHLSGSGSRSLWIRSVAGALVDAAMMARVFGLAGVSNYVRDRDVSKYRLSRSKASTIYNGVDLECYQPASDARRPDSRVRIIVVAWLIPAKGVDVLLRAFARLAEPLCELVVVGDGPEEPALKDLSHKLGIESHTQFLGLRDDVPMLLGAADVFVHPCLWEEACPLSVLEAMAIGLPTVASRIGGLPELIEDGWSGLLVPPGDDVRLAEVLDRLVRDGELRLRLGRNARLAAVDRFGLARCVKQHLDWCATAARVDFSNRV
jgi:glycosyltransferase involved in cell wall biosynthesis